MINFLIAQIPFVGLVVLGILIGIRIAENKYKIPEEKRFNLFKV